MSFLLRAAVGIVIFGTLQSTANACLPPAPPIELPGESTEDYKARSEAFWRATRHEEQRWLQTAKFDGSTWVILGIVQQSKAVDAGGVPGLQAEVKTVAPLKGDAAPAQVTLTDERYTSCGMVGGGTATGSRPGDYVVVFSDWYGIRLDEIREPRLFNAVHAVAAELRKASISEK